MLWEYIKEKMDRYPNSALSEGEVIYTYREVSAFAERLAAQLTGSCYGVLCRSELCAGGS